ETASRHAWHDVEVSRSGTSQGSFGNMDLTGCNTSSGIGLLHADMVEPVMANVAISGMCKGMMGIWILAMGSDSSVVQCGHEEQSPLL
ncbi:MAG: hypothetical protein ACKPKO_56025, partial [Candidatus Fonsibacter sp.]